MSSLASPDSPALAHRRWVSWRELRGQPTPKASSFDVATWTGAHTFALRGHECLFYFLAAVAHWALPRVWGVGARTGDDQRLTLWMGVTLVVGLIYALLWMRRGGWVTIDPARSEIVWRRPRDGRATRTWRFDEIVEAVDRGPSSGTVRIDVGTHRLRLRVPSNEGAKLADSLCQASVTPLVGGSP